MKSYHLLLSPLVVNLLATPLIAGNFFSGANNQLIAASISKPEKSSAPASSASPSIEQINLQNTLQPISASATVAQGWTVDTSLLYWNAKSEGFEFTQKASRTLELDAGKVRVIHSFTDTKNEGIPFDTWDCGVQIGLGYIFPQREQWITRLGWTHLNTDSHKSFSVAPGDVGAFPLIPSIAPFLLGSVATKAAGDWHLRYNILDAELGRQFFVGKWLALKPIIGLRGGWISQRFQTEYSSIFVTQSSGTFFLDTSFNSKQNLGGVGLRIGSDAKFYMGNAWSLLGNLSTSILWTSIDLKQTFDGYNPPPVGTPIANTVTSKDHFDKLRTNLEGQLGLQWETFYHQDRFRFAISTLYTFSYWFGVNQLTNQIIATSDSAQPTAISQISNGDLQLQGLNIKFDFDF